MHYRILGTTQALRDDGTAVVLGGARLRALLTVLALRPGRTVPSSSLVEEVWDGEPPADAVGALQALVGRLRRALGHAAVSSAQNGYRLVAGADAVDLYRFERLAGEGTRALADGDPATAAALLDDALALWRGPALADLPDRTALAARWAVRHLDARRTRFAALLALGHAEKALPDLVALCDDHPIDEPLQALRLRALRDAGRPAQALAAYDEVRRTLADRLGTEPGPELRSLHAELLLPAADRAAPPNPAPTPVPASASPPVRTPPPEPRRTPVRDAPTAAPDTYEQGHTPQPPHTPRPPRPAPVKDAADVPVPDVADAPVPDAVDARTPAPGAHPPDDRPGGTRAPHDAPAHSPGRAARPGGARSRISPAAPAPAPAVPPSQAAPAPGVPSAPAAPALASAGPASAAPVPPRGNLRARLTSFVGREADIRTLGNDLTRARLVTLLGPGGAGKTRLSQEVAETVATDWPDGVWMAELAPVDDPKNVPEAVLTALGARETVLRAAGAEELRAAEPHAGDPLRRLAEYCARRRMLLLLDNCEHVIAAAAELVDHLLGHCPGLTILATSREPLGVPGEFVRPVNPLPDPVALRLLADRGAAANPGFRIDADPDTAAASAEICHRLDGLPLAIELAAARLRMLGPRQIAERLDDRFRLLTSGSRTVLPRQQTLRAVVDWSWDLLDEAERTVLRRLSVFAGGCALAAAEEVCADTPAAPPNHPAPPSGGSPAGYPASAAAAVPRPSPTTVGPRDVAALLGSLVDKSLVIAAPLTDGEMRYRLLETVGEYAAERLEEAGERAAVERRHLVHYRELARTTDPELRGGGQRTALDRFQREYENLRTALRHAVAARDEQEALVLVLSLAWYWQMRDLRTDARQWSAAVGELGPDPFAPPGRRAPWLDERCTAAPPPMVPEQLEEARRGVRLIQAVSLDHANDDWTRDENLARLRIIADTYEPGQPQTCRTPGSLWFFAVLLTGEVDELRELLDATVRACRELGYAWELAAALQTRANVMANRPEWAGEARADADESLEIFVRLGDVWGAAESLSSRGEANERRGDYDGAAADFLAAIGYAEQLGAQSQVALLRSRYAAVLTETGRGEEGERILREVIAAGPDAGHEAMPIARLFLALWLGRGGHVEEAREQLQLLRAEFTTPTLAIFEGFVVGALAWLDNLEGRYADALAGSRQALRQSRQPLSRMVAPEMSLVHLVTVAWALAGHSGEHGSTVAARLLGARDGLRPDGYVEAAAERKNRVMAEELIRSRLGSAAYDTAYAEGDGLTLDEAAALADAYED
ncbi:BTAD domain-containing putative transcriptional regulator [Streptomyces sp. AM 4-1-1]|uniref:AfsR/SARP family transcriptional regulator n=1 Tax=Streptomyces sp. AM 4-1-1 TaxID=3028710 RepID=UPI0023B8EBA7|nr:BTAD domain-containing putative transcriptional regulator [Streptomyces sp. AM 4-1-1]WEH33081.1 BTAD domain-containing putative transcriptional regulator [Streptomyces sp. AM 4-1-1]